MSIRPPVPPIHSRTAVFRQDEGEQRKAGRDTSECRLCYAVLCFASLR
jgi:nuclear transport factor 2 (NTF2) superfamily protein